MKIGILTYHRNHNYGAILQAIATRLILQNMGHEVYYVDYKPWYIEEYYALFSRKECFSRGLHGAIRYINDCISNYKVKKQRISNFEAFIQKHIVPFCKSLNEEYDVVLYGSDQIWRKQRKLKSYDFVYFGNNDIHTKKHVSFAASMGILPATEAEKESLKILESKFDYITVREGELLDILKSIGITNASLLPDPTIMVENSLIWDNEIPVVKKRNSPYVLFYDLQPGAFDYKSLEEVVLTNGYELITIGGSTNNKSMGDSIFDAGPQEFLDLIRGASYVFSSSFHGVAFSLIYGKPFYASFKKNGGRAFSLLSQLNLSNQLLPPQTEITKMPLIDYSSVDIYLANIRTDSYKLICNILKNEK